MSCNRFLNFYLMYSDGPGSRYKWMVDCAHEAGLKVTHTPGPNHLRSRECLEELQKYRDLHGDEIALWIAPDDKMLDECGVVENPQFFCYHSRKAKRDLSRAMVNLYRETLKQPFEAAAYFNLDAASLLELKEAAPELCAIMALVFEEGINVLHGHRYFDLEWLCLTEGSPWWPWVPRKNNIAAPAGPGDEKIDLVCIPHLLRDMIQSFDARDDFFSCQPMDQMRSKSVWADNIEYTKRFFNEHMRQAEINNGYAYYQFFEGPGAMSEGCPSVYDEQPAQCRKVYEQYIEFLGQQVRDGTIRQVSTAQFGKWFLEHFGGTTPPTVSHWHDIRFDSGKEYVWFLDKNFRALTAASRGGSILDLRPYGARIDKESAGVDTEYLWDMSYPFIIQNHHRYTTICKSMLKYNGVARDLAEEFLTVARIDTDNNETVIRYNPKSIDFDTMTCEVEVECRFTAEGEILRSVNIINPSSTGGEIEFCEYFRGVWGTTDLPSNLAGLVLKVSAAAGDYGFVYNHRGRKIDLADTKYCASGYPGESFWLILSGEGDGWTGTAEEGTLFQTFYTLTLEKSQPLADQTHFATRICIDHEPVSAKSLDDSAAKPRRNARPSFKTAWAPSLTPRRCPRCLKADREVHLVERDGLHRCQFCSFAATEQEVMRLYKLMREENYEK